MGELNTNEQHGSDFGTHALKALIPLFYNSELNTKVSVAAIERLAILFLLLNSIFMLLIESTYVSPTYLIHMFSST